ncbi:unnamed protein product [Lactuca virosa]|uniref:Peroxin-14 n=1 Tax=Lactuca virosa TaxID=75947 RepID=A0AAU9PHW7_9ASTR|nr:unnamed protein product [Lactuca virosa]
MEIVSRQQHERENPSPTNSPSSHGSSSNSNGHTAGGGSVQTPPLTPRPVSRSEPNPYPTTFVQADTTSFKTSSPDANWIIKTDPPTRSGADEDIHTADQNRSTEETRIQALRASEQPEKRADDQRIGAEAPWSWVIAATP